jgi:hypothetical protein
LGQPPVKGPRGCAQSVPNENCRSILC